MLRSRILLSIKGCLILTMSIMTAACENKMLPINNPVEYQNQLVADKYGRWHVIPIQCPILFDETGFFKPSANVGCAQTHNLGLMIAHPEDLLDDPIMNYKRKPLIFRNQPLAISTQKYNEGRLPKLDQLQGQDYLFGGYGGYGGYGGFGGGGYGVGSSSGVSSTGGGIP